MRDVSVKLLDWTAQKDFTLIGDSLAKGTYGEIYLATHNRSGNDFVVKAVHKYISRSQGESTPQEELLLHKYISKCIPERLHVAKFIQGYEDDKYIYSVMEPCFGPTLASLLDANQPGLHQRAVALLFQKTATATMHLHSIGVLHRDIKPDNLMLVAPHGTSALVIIDFGLSLFIGDAKGYQSKWSVGSMLYAAPEVINAGYYTTACDVWSLGILLYRMLFGREPFSSFQEAADGRVPVPFPEDAHRFASQDAIDLITWMLKHDMHGRPSLQQVLVHEFTRSAADNVNDLVEQWLAVRASSKGIQSRNSSSGIFPSNTEPVTIPRSVAIPCRNTCHAPTHEVHNLPATAAPGGSHSLPLDYDELPSLSMPASIRRCQLPVPLEPQSRVHTLSAIADQTWREIEDNVAHRTAKTRERDPVFMPILQEIVPDQSSRLASLQILRPAEAAMSQRSWCSLPLCSRTCTPRQLDFHADDECSEADGWQGSSAPYASIPHGKSHHSLVDAAISPDLISASCGSEPLPGPESFPCDAGEWYNVSQVPVSIPNMPVEAIGTWKQTGGCDLKIGSAPNPSSVALADATDMLHFNPC